MIIMSIGSCDAYSLEILSPDVSAGEIPTYDLENSGQLLTKVIHDLATGELNHDSILVSSAEATRTTKGVDAKHLSKVWKIDLETAEQTIAITSQRCQSADDSKLPRNYATNDRMLRYQILSSRHSKAESHPGEISAVNSS